MGILISSDTQNGQLVQVVTRVGTEKEAENLRVLIKQDNMICPSCKKALVPTLDHMRITVYNPLSNTFGMELGRPAVDCQECGTPVQFECNIDLAAFPSTLSFLQSLRNEYKRRLEAAKAQKAAKASPGVKVIPRKKT